MPENTQAKPKDEAPQVPETPETEPGFEPAAENNASADEAGSAPSDEAATAPEVSTEERLQAEIAELKDRLLRAVAEAENVRRRAEKEKLEARKYGISGFARDLLSVADNFQRALSSVDDEVKATGGEVISNLVAGIEMTERELMSAFEKNGVVRVAPAKGEKFNPNFHQAMAEVPAADAAPGTVVEVVQPGFLLEDRLLRPAMVLVAGAAEGGDQEPSDD